MYNYKTEGGSKKRGAVSFNCTKQTTKKKKKTDQQQNAYEEMFQTKSEQSTKIITTKDKIVSSFHFHRNYLFVSYIWLYNYKATDVLCRMWIGEPELRTNDMRASNGQLQTSFNVRKCEDVQLFRVIMVHHEYNMVKYNVTNRICEHFLLL